MKDKQRKDFYENILTKSKYFDSIDCSCNYHYTFVTIATIGDDLSHSRDEI